MRSCSGWAELPRDVIQHVLLHFQTNVLFTLRLVSRNWALSSRQIRLSPVVIPCSQASLSVKIATLASWRKAGRFVASDFSFQTNTAMPTLELRKTTWALTQGCLTSCKILVDLEYAPYMVWDITRQKEQQHLEDAHRIAESAQQLLDENMVELCITMNRRSGTAVLPAPQVTQALKCFLRFDTCSVSTEQPAAGLPPLTDNLRVFSCCHKHVTALKDSNTQICTVQVDCGIDQYRHPHLTSCHDEVIAAAATMTHLTKLHLSLIDDTTVKPETNFVPLTRLTLLEDLALQCFDHPIFSILGDSDLVCCQGVLTSNKHTLLRVTLTGPWTAATYNSLQECSKLETVSISISRLNIDQAQAFASILADSFRLTLHLQLEADVLAAIKHSQPQIHVLTAWGTHQDEALKLPELLSLQELTLVNFVPFTFMSSGLRAIEIAADMQEYCPVTGEAFECYPMITKLTLIDCPGVSSKGSKCITEKAMPALQTLSIQATIKSDSEFLNNDCARAVRFDADSLLALSLGSSLRSIDLTGVSRLTTEALSHFRAALRLKQCQGVAPPTIDLLLPRAACLSRAVASLITTRSMFVPNILRSFDCCDAEQIVL